MKKQILLLFVFAALIVIVAMTFKTRFTRTIDWEESFNEKSNKPYGLSVFYKELPILFKAQKTRTVYHQPASYLKAHDANSNSKHIASGSYIIIGNSDYLEEDSIDELLNFADTGNTLFISDYYFSQKIHDTLHINTSFSKNLKDSTTYLSLKSLNIKNIAIDKNIGVNYFSKFDSINYKILGRAKTDSSHVNFLQVPFGKGTIYLHLEPKIFTNYNLLKDNRYKYVEGVISYLPEDNVYFDSYNKIQANYNGEVEKESNLSWFLQQKSFRWAWYSTLLFTFLFVVFNAKRRQRIIKTIKPLQNTTVNFVKTVSNLYFETQDHKNLINKKITYFLERIRIDFNIDTSVLNEDFINKLTLKSGNKKEVTKRTIEYINWLRSKNEFFEDNLIHLNRLIETFYFKNYER